MLTPPGLHRLDHRGMAGCGGLVIEVDHNVSALSIGMCGQHGVTLPIVAMRAVRWISSLGLIAAAAFQPAFAEGMDREQLLEQMKAMRPVDLVVLDQTDSPQEYTLGIFAVSADAVDPEMRRFKLWQEYADNLVIPTETVNCSREEPLRVTRDTEAIYVRKLNPGGPMHASTREDHLVWWGACHPDFAGQDPAGLSDKARELGYSTQLIESQEVLRLPAP